MGDGREVSTPWPIALFRRPEQLLHFNACTLLFEFRLHRRGLVLGYARLHDARGSINEILGFLESKSGQLAHDLDDLDLLGARFLEGTRELSLLFSSRSRTSAGATSCRCRADWRRGNRDVELALESFDELGELEYRHATDRVENLVLAHGCVCHCVGSPGEFLGAFALTIERVERACKHVKKPVQRADKGGHG